MQYLLRIRPCPVIDTYLINLHKLNYGYVQKFAQIEL